MRLQELPNRLLLSVVSRRVDWCRYSAVIGKIIGAGEYLRARAISDNRSGGHGTIAGPKEAAGVIPGRPVKVANVKRLAGTDAKIVDAEIVGHGTEASADNAIDGKMLVCRRVRNESVAAIEGGTGVKRPRRCEHSGCQNSDHHVSFHERRATPNDLKLSERGARRGSCVAERRERQPT